MFWCLGQKGQGRGRVGAGPLFLLFCFWAVGGECEVSTGGEKDPGPFGVLLET